MTTEDRSSEDEFSRQMRRAVRALPDAPLALQQAAIGLWPSPASALAGAAGALAQALLHRIAAVLTFDSWAAPAVAQGMRSLQSPTRHLLFSAQGRDIDLRIAPAGALFSITGQVLGPDEHGAVTLTRIDAADEPALPAALDALGEFRIDGLRLGRYQLTLRLGSGDITEIALPPVEVGTPPH